MVARLCEMQQCQQTVIWYHVEHVHMHAACAAAYADLMPVQSTGLTRRQAVACKIFRCVEAFHQLPGEPCSVYVGQLAGQSI